MKLVILPFGQLVGQSVSQTVSRSVRKCVVMWSGARMILFLLFIVLELYSLVHCCCEPAEAPFSLCDMFECTA